MAEPSSTGIGYFSRSVLVYSFRSEECSVLSCLSLSLCVRAPCPFVPLPGVRERSVLPTKGVRSFRMIVRVVLPSTLDAGRHVSVYVGASVGVSSRRSFEAWKRAKMSVFVLHSSRLHFSCRGCRHPLHYSPEWVVTLETNPSTPPCLVLLFFSVSARPVGARAGPQLKTTVYENKTRPGRLGVGVGFGGDAVRYGTLRKVCVCYTSDLQTSSIFTVDYYKGVAKSAADAGAHMIGIKVMRL